MEIDWALVEHGLKQPWPCCKKQSSDDVCFLCGEPYLRICGSFARSSLPLANIPKTWLLEYLREREALKASRKCPP